MPLVLFYTSPLHKYFSNSHDCLIQIYIFDEDLFIKIKCQKNPFIKKDSNSTVIFYQKSNYGYEIREVS